MGARCRNNSLLRSEVQKTGYCYKHFASTRRSSNVKTDVIESPAMKINRRNFLLASSSALVLSKTQLTFAKQFPLSETSAAFSLPEREVAVYTTADNSNHRLARTET